MCQKEWVGRNVHVIPVDIFEEALKDMLKGHRFGNLRTRCGMALKNHPGHGEKG